MPILSIQSHVVYGHVGNRAAVFPLERLGHEVWPVNTVQFANHSGYGPVRGLRFEAAHIRDLIAGLDDRGVLADCTALLSGYLGSPAIAEAVLDALALVRSRNPKAVFCCDPVMGDEDTGLFVDPAIPTLMRERMLSKADIITPNLFELELLSGTSLDDSASVRRALDCVHALGPRIILVTSWRRALHHSIGTTGMLISGPRGVHTLEMPLVPLDPVPHGGGDLSAALFLAHWLSSEDERQAMERTAWAVNEVYRRTLRTGGSELALVASQDAFALDEGSPRSIAFNALDPLAKKEG